MVAGLAGRALLAGTIGAAPLLGWARPAEAAPGRPVGRRPDGHGPDVLTDWYGALYSGLMDEGTTPPPAARIYACIGVAAYEAVAGASRSLVSLAGRLNGLSGPPRVSEPSSMDWPTVVSASINATATSLVRSASPALQNVIDEQFLTHLEDQASAGVPSPIIRRSIAHGRRVGEHVARWAATDGADLLAGTPYTPPVGEALWRSTPPNFGPAIDPHWGSVRPMALPAADALAPPPPPADFSTGTGSAFYQQAVTVLDTFDALTDEQRGIALFWRDNPITSGLPSGHWMLLVGQLCQDGGLSLDRAAEAHALAGIALADAFTSCWHQKYVTNLLRPVSYIRAHVPGRGDWLSFVNTPQFPEYTSGHSVASQAVVTVLSELFGTVAFTDRTHQRRNPQLGARSFSSLQQAADEAAHSRLLGGIHYPMGIEQGLIQGGQVGRAVLARLAPGSRRQP